jgi:hypothetical protein
VRVRAHALRNASSRELEYETSACSGRGVGVFGRFGASIFDQPVCGVAVSRRVLHLSLSGLGAGGDNAPDEAPDWKLTSPGADLVTPLRQ